MKNIKKILFCAGMAACLSTLNGCGNKEVEDKIAEENTIDTNEKIIEEEINQCLKNHYDEISLDVKTLSSGNKYITNESIHYSIIEQFLNNSVILQENDYNHKKVYELFKFENNLSLYNNVQIKRYFGNFIKALEEKYQREFTVEEILALFYENGKIDEDGIAFSFAYDYNNIMRQFLLWANPGSLERIVITIKNDNNIFLKENEIKNFSYENLTGNIVNETSVNQNYSLKYESNAESTLDVEWYVDKDAILEQDYSCDSFKSTFVLRIGLESLEMKLNEEQTVRVLETLNVASENEYDLNKYITTNNDLFVELFGVDYLDFLEVSDRTLKLKK